jgi:hypothetical protein
MNEELINHPDLLLKEKPKKYGSFILLMFILLIIYLLNQKITTTINVQGIVKEINGYKLVLYIPYQNVVNLNYSKLLIENESYNYKIKKINSELIQIDSLNIQEVIVEVDLKEDWQINNLILETKIIKGEEKVYQKLWNDLKERE